MAGMQACISSKNNSVLPAMRGVLATACINSQASITLPPRSKMGRCWAISSKLSSIKYANLVAKFLTADDFPTCLAPRNISGFRVAESRQFSNSLSMVRSKYIHLIKIQIKYTR